MRCAEPVGYLDFLSLQAGAGIIVTDSGGVQEEASALGVPCYTLRANTERPVTITRGTNVLLGDDPASLLTIPIAWRPPTPCAIPLWDGRAADRARGGAARRLPRPGRDAEGGMSPRADVLGCAIDRLDLTETLAAVEQVIASGRFTQHMSINAAKLVTMHDDARMREIIGDCGLVNADGQSVVWASRLLGDPLPERVAGIDLMGALLGPRRAARLPRLLPRRARRGAGDGARADPRAPPGAARSPGARDGYFTDDEAAAVCAAIHASRADLLFVAMTSPRKEYFLGEHGPGLGVPFVMGVGGSIDVIAGVTRRAPLAWQRLGLEWLFRLLQEPRRMFKRYAVTNTRFALLVGRALLTRSRPRHQATGADLTTLTMDAAVTPRGVAELIDFALEALPAMRLDDGVFCFERRAGELAPIGRSPRYTLMVELGLLRAQAAGYELPFDVDELDAAAWRELERGNPDAGRHRADAVDRRAPRRRARRRSSASRLDAALAAAGGLAGAARDGARAGSSPASPTTPPRAAARPATRLLARVARPAAGAQPRPEPPVPPLRRARVAPAVPELRHPDLLRAGAGGRRPPRARRAGAARRARRRRPAARAAAARRRLAVAVRRRARHRGRALRGLLGAPGRDGADGAVRAVGGHRRPALPRRRGARAAHGSTATTSSALDMVDRENGLVLRSIRRRRGPDRALARRARPARRSPACRRPARPRA